MTVRAVDHLKKCIKWSQLASRIAQCLTVRGANTPPMTGLLMNPGESLVLPQTENGNVFVGFPQLLCCSVENQLPELLVLRRGDSKHSNRIWSEADHSRGEHYIYWHWEIPLVLLFVNLYSNQKTQNKNNRKIGEKTCLLRNQMDIKKGTGAVFVVVWGRDIHVFSENSILIFAWLLILKKWLQFAPSKMNRILQFISVTLM